MSISKKSETAQTAPTMEASIIRTQPRSREDVIIVLVVDDDPNITNLISEALARPKVQVIISHEMELALEGVPKFKCSLAFIDVFMPGMGGIEGIRLLRQQHPDCKIIAMSGGWTGMPAEKALRAAERIGADAILAKPFRVNDIEEIASRLLVDRI